MSQARGDLSKARCILKEIDLLLDIVQDSDVFPTISDKEIETLEDGLLRSRGATANIMATSGDNRGFPSTPLQLRNKDNEYGNAFGKKWDDGVSEEGNDRG